MSYQSFVTPLHTKTKRDYLARVNQFDKADCAIVAKKFESDYWDGERQFGYGGYHYDGRWSSVAKKMIDHYQLKNGMSLLDIGCGKGFLLYEFKKLLPGLNVKGIDISKHAVINGKEEIRKDLVLGHAKELPFADKSFDLIISNTTLHNLKIYDLFSSFKEINRVSKEKSWICVESYRNEKEKVNLLYWQLTCESFYSPEEWDWIFKQTNFSGDHEFIYFE